MNEPEPFNILIVDDDEEGLDLLAYVLRRDYTIKKATSGEQALEVIADGDIQMVISDHWMTGMSGIDLLQILLEKQPEIVRILISGFKDVRLALEAINKVKVHRYITKPWDPSELRLVVAQEAERYRALHDRSRLMEDLVRKNAELTQANEEIMSQKRQLEELAKEYKEQKEIALGLSEKFAQANLDLLKAQEEVKLKNLKLEAANKKLELLSITDGLTGFYNHRHLHQLLESEVGRATRYHLDLTCLMIDLDKFKQINDTFGHPFGDVVLKTVAKIIREDVRDTDFPARYGGDEFLVILPHTDLEQAVALAERIKADIISHPFVAPGGQDVVQTVSIGVANFAETRAKSKDELIRFVDDSLYRAKQKGRNRIEMYEPAG
jgi:diguanylate cyclase (GGDEF)-like protein